MLLTYFELPRVASVFNLYAMRVVGLGRLEWFVDENLVNTTEKEMSAFDDRLFMDSGWAGKELHVVGSDSVSSHEIRLCIAGAAVEPSPRTPDKAPVRLPTIRDVMLRTPDIRFKARDSIVHLHHTGSRHSPSSINVKRGGRQIGTISKDGSVSADAEISLDDLLDLLQEFSQDPKRAIESYGRETGECGVCGRTLTNPESIRRGIGPVCAGRVAGSALGAIFS